MTAHPEDDAGKKGFLAGHVAAKRLLDRLGWKFYVIIVLGVAISDVMERVLNRFLSQSESLLLSLVALVPLAVLIRLVVRRIYKV